MLDRVRRLLGQSAVYGLGDLLARSVAFLLVPVYTRFLSPADYAVLAVAGTFGAVVGILLELGLRGAATRFHYDFPNDQQERRAYYGTIWIFLTLAGLLLALIIDWQGDPLFRLIFRDVPFRPYGRLALWLAYVSTASMVPLVLFRVREQAHLYVLFSVGRFLLTTVAVIIFVTVLQQGAQGSLRGQLLVGALFAVPYTIVTVRNVRMRISWDRLRDSLAFGLPLVPHLLSSWALSMSDRVLLTHYVSLEQLGLYSLGYRFGQILDMILTSINMAWAPFFYRTATTEEDAPRVLGRLTTYYTFAILTLGLGIALLSKDVIAIIAEPAYLGAHRVVPVVVLAFLSHGFYFMVVNQLFFAKRTSRLPVFTAISAIVNVGLNLLTLPSFGIMAAAWNTLVGYAVLTILVFQESNRVYPVPYEYRRLAILLLAAGVVFVVGSQVQFSSPYLNLAIRSLSIVLFPVALLALRFFTPREIEAMRMLLAGAKRRFRAVSEG